MKGFEHKYTLSTVYLIERSLFGCFIQRSGLNWVFMSVIYRMKLYRSVIQLPFSYILVNWMAKLYPVFNFSDSRPGYMRRILDKGNSVVLTGASVQSTLICVKRDRICFFTDGVCLFDVFAWKKLKSHQSNIWAMCFASVVLRFLWNVLHQHLNPRYLWVIEEKGHRKVFA